MLFLYSIDVMYALCASLEMLRDCTPNSETSLFWWKLSDHAHISAQMLCEFSFLYLHGVILRHILSNNNKALIPEEIQGKAWHESGSPAKVNMHAKITL